MLQGKEGKLGQSCEQVHDGVGVQGGAPVVQYEIGSGSVCVVGFCGGGRGSLLPQLELDTQVLQTNACYLCIFSLTFIILLKNVKLVL